jgi:hypothetical protein
MRIVAMLAALATFVALGGCFFHHDQVYTAQPEVLPPLK